MKQIQQYCFPSTFLPITLLTTLLSCLLLSIISTPASAKDVKVGVYSNKPLVFQDHQGVNQGLTIDILSYIAKQEGWKLQFIEGNWAECLQRLEKGEIDLQVAIAISSERKKKFSYPEQTLITNWGRIYRHSGQSVETFPDLAGKRVALLEKDIHSRFFLQIMKRFDQQVNPLYVHSYDAVLAEVEEGRADIGVVNRLYALQNAHRFQVEATSMIFNPIKVHYAAPKGKDELLQAIDYHLEDLKQNRKSIYYQSFEKWFGDPLPEVVPSWLKPALLLVTVLFVLVLSISFMLRKRVEAQTAELKDVNRQLTDQLSQLQLTEEELQQSKANLQDSQNIAKMGRWELDLVNNCLHWSQNIFKIFEIDPEKFPASYEAFLEAIHPDDREKVNKAYSDSLSHKQQYKIEHRLLMPDGRIKWVIEICRNEYNRAGEAIRSIGIVQDITEQKSVAQKYQELVEGTNDLIIQMDAHGRLLYVNHTAKELSGLDPDELKGRNAFDFAHPDDRERTELWFKDCISRQVAKETIESRVLNQKTGAVHDLLWTGNYYYDTQGQLVSYNAIAHDITDRKKMENAIRKSEEQWDRTFNSFPDIVTLQDTNLHIIRANQAACDTLGLPDDAVIGHHCHELFHGISEPCPNCPLLETKKSFTPYSREIFHEKLGKTFLVSAAPVMDEQGELEFIAHVAKDITEAKELEKDRIRLAAAIEQASETVLVTDLKGCIQYVNPAFTELTGYSCEEAIGKNPRILKSGKHDKAFYKDMWSTLLQGKTWKGHLTNTKKDGTLFEEEATISPVTNSKGMITNFVAVKRDVSREVLLENQLRQSIKMEAVGTMASGIAHDFNNILSAIIGYAEFIQEDVAKESKVGKNIAEILTAGKRAADVVSQILKFSRQQASKKQALQPHLIVKEALKMLHATLPATITIQEDINPASGSIIADPTSIHQIVVNLCNNGLQAMAEQKGTLRVGLQQQQLSVEQIQNGANISAGSFVVLTVSDNGCGMDQPTIERIFEPYFSTKEVGRGTGLGLSVIHGIVKGYRGFIEVKSTVGKGSTFSVYFPVTDEPVIQAVTERKDIKEEVVRGNERILIVDDEKLLVKINEKRLQGLGYRVTPMTDSSEALEAFRSTPENFDLLITDQTMPGLTGAELARAILKIKPSLPIIMCTGHSDIVSEEDAFAMGIKKYVFKPLHGDELLDAVGEVLAESLE